MVSVALQAEARWETVALQPRLGGIGRLNPEERLAPIVEMTDITEAVREAIAYCQGYAGDRTRVTPAGQEFLAGLRITDLHLPSAVLGVPVIATGECHAFSVRTEGHAPVCGSTPAMPLQREEFCVAQPVKVIPFEPAQIGFPRPRVAALGRVDKTTRGGPTRTLGVAQFASAKSSLCANESGP
jgi:hypothetical protein